MTDSYYIAQKMKWDKNQSVLTGTGIMSNDKAYAQSKNSYTIFDKRVVFCPFCLHNFEINKFLIENKSKGSINKLFGKCPNCNNDMMLKTLDDLNKMTIKEFAKWCFNYRLNGFWGKVTRNESKGSELGDKYFHEWNSKLKMLSDNEGSDSIVFWDTYKALRGDSINE